MSTGKLVSGLLAGIAVGSILGILFAPEKGSETRNKISDKRNEFMGNLKSKCSELGNSLKKKFENIEEEATDFAERANNQYYNVKKNVQNNS